MNEPEKEPVQSLESVGFIKTDRIEESKIEETPEMTLAKVVKMAQMNYSYVKSDFIGETSVSHEIATISDAEILDYHKKTILFSHDESFEENYNSR